MPKIRCRNLDTREPRQSSAEVSRQKKLAVRRLMFVITEGQYVLSHRVGLAMAARDAGWEVTIVTETREHGQRIRALGFEVIDFTFSKRRFSLWTNFTAILKLYHIYRCYRPHLVHHVSLQPSLLGSIAAAFARVPAVINGITGMGFALTHNSLRARAIRSVLLPTLRWASRRDRAYTMTQNSDDAVLVMSFGIEHNRIVRMCDTGVNVERFVTAPEPPGPVRVTMVSRLIWDKGVREFLEAASRVRAMRDDIVFTLVGVPDESNPAPVPIEKITEGTAAGHVEWWGYQTDVNSVWSRSHIAALPSYYREGIPLSLLEACACGRPIVTTDIPGCRDIVQHGRDGLLVPPRDVEAFVDAVIILADDPPLRASMGLGNRKRAEAEFSDTRAGERAVQFYEKVYQRKRHDAAR